ncbi:MAG: Mbov_0395 family pilin-like conjugal transfer protein, partial [Candidatus Paceibacteria bacterium]
MSFFSNLKNKKSLLFGLILFFSFLVVAPKPVQAQDFGLDQVRQTTNLGDRPLIEIVGNIINIFLGLLGIIALVLIIYGGYLIMTSGGNEEQVQDGKKVLINAVIGLAIILAAFGITNFVINALTDATGAGGPGGVGQASGPQFQTFSGSGALGEKVQDHFPERDQKGVKRNTKISVTFNFPIDPGSVLENTNDTCWDGNGTATSSDAVCDPDNDNQMEQPPYYGDCIQDGGANNKFKWEEDCDQISTSSVQISKTTSTDPNKKGVNLMKAAGMIAYEDASSQSQAKAKTFTFKTIDMLGSNLEKKWHTVTLTNNIKRKKTKQGGQQHMDLFSGVNSYYEWKFQTDTNFDFNPPEVTSVYPAKRDNKQQPRPKIFKNSIIQINFSEPVDPTMV